jgi:hypothetical protein
MRLAAIVSMIVLTLAFGRALAADPATPAPAAGDERQKLLDAGALMVQGKYNEAIEAAKGLLRTAKEDTTRTDAARVIAESLRKKGEWKAAAAAYLKLRDRYEKGSDNSVKNEAIAEILTASPTGVYPPLEAAEAKVKPATPNAETSAADPAAASPAPAKPAGANLADDNYLARAIACLASARIEKIKARIASIKKARTPQEAEAAFAALAEDIRQARSLSSSGSAEPEQAVAQAANERLADLGKQVVATLNAKLADFQAAVKNHSLTLMQRKEMEGLQTLCTDLAKNEASFQATAGKLTALTDGAQSRDSSQREAEYTRLAKAFEPPPIDTSRSYGGGGNWGGGGFGAGGGGVGGRAGGGRGGR